MRSKNILLTAALSLTMSALTAQSADTQITAIPFIIHAPGTYALISDLTMNCNCEAFTIDPSVTTGTIVIDLKGHTITGNQLGGVLSFVNNNSVNSSSIVLKIKNGTVFLFNAGIDFENFASLVPTIEIKKLNFVVVVGTCIKFVHVNGAKVTDCAFSSVFTGIQDIDSLGGNLYSNLAFKGGVAPGSAGSRYLEIDTDEGDPLSFDRLRFDTLPNFGK